MLQLKEYQLVHEDVNMLDEKIDQKTYEESSTYEIQENEESLTTTVRLFNENDECIMECEVEDYDTAQVYLSETFDIIEEE